MGVVRAMLRRTEKRNKAGTHRADRGGGQRRPRGAARDAADSKAAAHIAKPAGSGGPRCPAPRPKHGLLARSRDEPLAAVDVVGRAGDGGVGHEVHGEAATSAGPTTRPMGSVARSSSCLASMPSPSSNADGGVSTKPAAMVDPDRREREGGLNGGSTAVAADTMPRSRPPGSLRPAWLPPSRSRRPLRSSPPRGSRASAHDVCSSSSAPPSDEGLRSRPHGRPGPPVPPMPRGRWT
jgi:hypothetical protein